MFRLITQSPLEIRKKKDSLAVKKKEEEEEEENLLVVKRKAKRRARCSRAVQINTAPHANPGYTSVSLVTHSRYIRPIPGC